MTAEEIYQVSLSYLYEYKNKDKDYKAFFLTFLNVTLQECKNVQNSILISNGEEPLWNVPWIESMDEVVPYDDDLTKVAIPYNIASLFYQDDNNSNNALDYRARYISACQEYTKAISTAIEDVY